MPTKLGTKQTPEHIAKRIKSSSEHYAWKGQNISDKSGRSRALKMYQDIGPCTSCGADKAERHHKDGDTVNNAQDNIVILCRRCHMKIDGRLEALVENRRKVPASVYRGAHKHRQREKGKFVNSYGTGT